MIEGTNSSTLGLSQEDFETYAQHLRGPTSMDSVLDNLKKRRENVLTGGVNCIPLPFERFRSEIPGIEKGQYVVVTASEKTGKTQLSSFIYLYTVLDYAFEHPDQCSSHIIYFALEESIQKIKERYMSYLLYKFNGLRIAPTDLRSTSIDYLVPEEVLTLLESPKYQERLKFFDDNVQFETENTNPTGILRVCETYMKSVGRYVSHKKSSEGLVEKEIEIFDSYEQYDKKHYVIAIIDHLGLADREQGFTIKGTMDKVSEYAVKYLRNRYGMTIVAVQQQAAESQGLEAVKLKRMLPTVATLGDSKYTARDKS